MIRFLNKLLPKKYQNNRGIWWGLPVLLGAGVAGIASEATKKDKVKNSWLQNPEYPEAEAARGRWWETLQKWGSDPNYGAIAPDWSNIWEGVQRKIKEYYGGSALSPGIRDKIRSNLARRGVSESPAADYMLMASGVEEANQLKDAAIEQATQQAQLSESGRQTWLNSLMNLSAQKPAGQWQTTVTSNKASDILGAVSRVGSSLATYGMQSDILKELKNKDMPKVSASPYWLDTSRWR